MTARARRRLRFGLQAKLVAFGLALAVAPLVAVWTVGVVEDVLRGQVEGEIDRCLDDLRPELAAIEAPERVARLARDCHVMVRVVGPDGAVRERSDPRHAERWAAVRGLWHGLDDVWFGPAGPPDLLAFESTLPAEPRRPEVRAALAGRRAAVWRYDADARMFVYAAAEPLPSGGALSVTRISRRVIRSLYDVRWQLLKLTLFMAVTSALFGLFVGRRLVAPLLRMERQIDAYLRNPGAGRDGAEPGEGRDGLAALELGRGDELGDLSRSFKELALRLRRQVDETASVAGDVAHDLKNPIATVAAAAELLESPPSAERQARLARALSDAAEHLRRSVDGLLALARLDAVLSSAERGPVDLGRLVTAEVERVRDTTRPTIAIDVRVGAGDTVVAGVEDQLAVIVRNLLDNALVFARSAVLIEVTRADGEVVLEVCDDGPGVSGGNREKIFGRFFTSRPEGSPAGTGLGLAIARAVARAHGGDVELLDPTESPLPGARFSARFPALQPAP